MSWIDINEKKPELNKRVLVYSKKIYASCLDKHGNWDYSDCCGCSISNVTHWMLLPEVPE